ncbi:MAG TPA: hypothetical protein VEI95_01830 [Acidobacteriota bacterium]|nr:hypothetical protein [Acidobacteriota bacterium]
MHANIARLRLFLVILAPLTVTTIATPSDAQDSVVEGLKRQITEMQGTMQKMLERIDQLEKEKSATSGEIEQLQKEKSATTARIGQVEKSVQAVQSAPTALNPAIGLVLDANVQNLGKAGGNFDFRSAELGIAASVDPFARMYSFINGSQDGVEVDEAAAITTSLPWNLTAKGGRFLADFGRFPKVHEHELPFVNEPLSIQRMVGGETQADGMEVNYLFPTPFFLRATLGGMNKIGEDNNQVNNSKPRSWSQFTYLGRLNTYFDVTDNHSIELGTSMAYTPSVRLSGDPSGGDRTLNGIDLTYRYQPLSSAVYQGFTWGSEFFANSARFPFTTDAGEIAKRRRSYGGYSYGELKLNKNWSTGFQVDYAPNIDTPSQRTMSYSPFLTWNLSEFNRLRFQYSYLNNNFSGADKTENGNQVFLQWTTVIGAHTHGFLSR